MPLSVHRSLQWIRPQSFLPQFPSRHVFQWLQGRSWFVPPLPFSLLDVLQSPQLDYDLVCRVQHSYSSVELMVFRLVFVIVFVLVLMLVDLAPVDLFSLVGVQSQHLCFFYRCLSGWACRLIWRLTANIWPMQQLGRFFGWGYGDRVGTDGLVVRHGLSNISLLHIIIVPKPLRQEAFIVQWKFNRHNILFT